MFEADADMSKLKYLPGIDDMTERYRTHVQGVAELYRTAGLANASKKEQQVSRVFALYQMWLLRKTYNNSLETDKRYNPWSTQTPQK